VEVSARASSIAFIKKERKENKKEKNKFLVGLGEKKIK
jgi:hypothetical protein